MLDDEEPIVKTYDQMINETLNMFIGTLSMFKINEPYLEEPKVFDEPDLYKKIFELKLIEPNLFNKFKDYWYIAIDRYPEKRKTHILEFIDYQQEFIGEFLRDIMFFWGYGTGIPKVVDQILYKPTKRRRKRRL